MTAMSLVTWSPAIGITAVWRIAPPENTAMSVVPPPMSTGRRRVPSRRRPASAWLEASCSSTMSSTSRAAALHALDDVLRGAVGPGDDVHLGLEAHAGHADRLADALLRSMMNSCGRMCGIFWSAGIATARAASITRSTSPWATSLSRIATMPCEFSERTCEPAMPANTEWIWQPPSAPASSTARWIDCTVDSMFTTTPFFRPREGCEPRPIDLDRAVGPSSPTIATTFEVPMSRPTIRLRSDFFSHRGRRLLRCHGERRPAPSSRRWKPFV